MITKFMKRVLVIGTPDHQIPAAEKENET